MNLIEALKLLNEGKKVRRKDWELSRYICLNKDKNIVNQSGCRVLFTVDFDDIKNEHWEEYNEDILDKEEKQYLESILKPYKDRVDFVIKQGIGDYYERIVINVSVKNKSYKNYIALPYFDKGTMYKGIEIDKKYTVNELGLYE